MPKQGTRAEVNTFIQGLITEASPLNFPPNASKEEENFVLNRDGTRHRRLGMNFSPTHVLRTSTISPAAVNNSGKNVFKWIAPAGVQTLEILVIQLGAKLYFYDLSAGFDAPGAFLQEYTPLASFPGNIDFSFASVDGKLLVTAGQETIMVLHYDPVTQTFEEHNQFLKVRDFWGVEVVGSPYETDKLYRGGNNIFHRYNLQNQSWGIARKDSAGVLGDPVDLYNASLLFPSNSEVVWTGLQYQPIVGTADPFERIYPNLYVERLGANVDAPKGYYIIDLLRRGDARKLQFEANYDRSGGVLTEPTFSPVLDATLGGPSCVTDFAGRAFFSGFPGDVTQGDARSPNLSNYVVFSQLVKSAADISKCYQEGDPTSREASDIVDTDGGFVRISGAKKIISLQRLGANLIILADNGVWSLTGGSDFGFTPTNFKVTKISTFGCNSATAVVAQGAAIMYWGSGGIYAVSLDKYAQVVVNSLTQTTIQKFYDTIPEDSKQNCHGVYDDTIKKVSWIFKTGLPFSTSSVTRELVLDTTLNAFSLNRISGLVKDTVTQVECMFPFYTDMTGYVTLVRDGTSPCKFGLATYQDIKYRDWRRIDGIGEDAKAFLLTGSQIAGDSAVEKQIPYVLIHMRRTETETDALGVPLDQSSCQFRTFWDWAINTKSNKVTQFQQAYRYRLPFLANLPDTSYDNGFEQISTKNKVRGRGRAFGLYFETEPDKNCHITGWNLTINGNPIA